MPGFKGRALVYPGLLIAGWIVGRSISLSATHVEPLADRAESSDVRLASVDPGLVRAACPMPWIPHLAIAQTYHPPLHQVASPIRMRRTAIMPDLGAGRVPDTGFAEMAQDFGPVKQPFRLASSVSATADGKEEATAATQRRLQFYSYNFWRQDSAGAALAPQAQYGGSQYGAIATWDPLGSAGKGPALLVRASGTPDGLQQEVAVGARWQPDRKWPVSISVERRFRFYGKDGFSAYVAGGVDTVPLVGKLTLDAYGQAGYSLGGISSPFVDAQARVQHPLAKPLGIPIRIGAGAWVGGQKGAYRADIGPTLSAQIDNRFADFTLQLDWRKRVVGNAAPVDGLALTVATDF